MYSESVTEILQDINIEEHPNIDYLAGKVWESMTSAYEENCQVFQARKLKEWPGGQKS